MERSYSTGEAVVLKGKETRYHGELAKVHITCLERSCNSNTPQNEPGCLSIGTRRRTRSKPSTDPPPTDSVGGIENPLHEGVAVGPRKRAVL